MEAFARAPEPLQDKKPMDKTWKMWKQEFIIFLQVADIDKKTSKEKAALFMNIIGKVGVEALQNMEFENEQEKYDYDFLIKKFDEYYDPPKTETQERFKFYTRSKKNNESIETYIADLKEKAKTCNFEDLTDSLVRDMVILDVKDKHFRKMIFEKKSMDLNKLSLFYKQYELNTEKMKEVTKKVTSENPETKETKSTNEPPSFEKKSNICWRCGITHPPKNCPAIKSLCERCKEKGHFTQRCNNKNQDSNTANPNVNKTKNNTKNPFKQTEKNKN